MKKKKKKKEYCGICSVLQTSVRNSFVILSQNKLQIVVKGFSEAKVGRVLAIKS